MSVLAFFSAEARSDGARASLLTAYGLARQGATPTIVRAVPRGEPGLLRTSLREPPFTVAEVRSATSDMGGLTLDAEIAKALSTGGVAVLDLPASLLGDRVLRERIDVAVVPVGPRPLDEIATIAFVTALLAEDGGLIGEGGSDKRLPWLMGIDRSGTPASAMVFETTARDAGGAPYRTLPLTLPRFGRTDDTALLTQAERSPRVIRAADGLAAVLSELARGVCLDPDDVRDRSSGRGAGPVDGRSLSERVKDLGDDLADLEACEGEPPPGFFEGAPRLEEWRFRPSASRRLVGRLHTGHPDIDDGRLMTTSDVFVSDGVTWARTLSRAYVLGEPAPDGDHLPDHDD